MRSRLPQIGDEVVKRIPSEGQSRTNANPFLPIERLVQVGQSASTTVTQVGSALGRGRIMWFGFLAYNDYNCGVHWKERTLGLSTRLSLKHMNKLDLRG